MLLAVVLVALVSAVSERDDRKLQSSRLRGPSPDCMPSVSSMDAFVREAEADGVPRVAYADCAHERSADEYGIIGQALVTAALRPLFAHAESFREPGVLMIHSLGEGNLVSKMPLVNFSASVRTAEELLELVMTATRPPTAGHDGYAPSAVVRYERFAGGVRRLHEALDLRGGSDAKKSAAKSIARDATSEVDKSDTLDARRPVTSTHLYISGKGASALHNHTDPYPVIVLGLHGAKQWRVCTPTAKTRMLTRIRTGHHCAGPAYGRSETPTAGEMRSLDCSLVWLRPGDALYLPMGTVHSAAAAPDGSAHVTFGLEVPPVMAARRLVLCPVVAFGPRVLPLVVALGAMWVISALRRQLDDR